MKVNALPPTIGANQSFLLDYFNQNVRKDSTFKLSVGGAGHEIRIKDSLAVTYYLLGIDRYTRQGQEIRDVIIRREFDTTKVKSAPRTDTLAFYPAMKQSNSRSTVFTRDSLQLTTSVYSAARLSAWLRVELQWYPLFPDSIVLVRRK